MVQCQKKENAPDKLQREGFNNLQEIFGLSNNKEVTWQEEMKAANLAIFLYTKVEKKNLIGRI